MSKRAQGKEPEVEAPGNPVMDAELMIIQQEQRRVHQQLQEAREMVQVLEQQALRLAGAREALVRVSQMMRAPTGKKAEAKATEVNDERATPV